MIVTEPPSSSSGEALFAALRTPEFSRFLLRVKKSVGLTGEVTVLLCGDARIRTLNRDFRGKNKATDVLSFPAADNAEGAVGDLAISVETAAKQAAQHGHTLADELRVLMLHGVLHLAGFDHEVDAGEMRTREAELRTLLKLPGGLIERTLSTRQRRTPGAAAVKAKPVLGRAR